MSARAERWVGENQLGKSMLSELGTSSRISACRRGYGPQFLVCRMSRAIASPPRFAFAFFLLLVG
jgi:hypothetical protein